MLSISDSIILFQLWFYQNYAAKIIPGYKMVHPIRRKITFQEFIKWVIKSDPDTMNE